MLGTYVRYKNDAYLIVGMTDGQLKLNSPIFKRVKVNVSSVVSMNCNPAKLVNYKDRKYLVTDKNHIFSITTGKEIWKTDPSNGNRKAVLYLAGNLPGYSKP